MNARLNAALNSPFLNTPTVMPTLASLPTAPAVVAPFHSQLVPQTATFDVKGAANRVLSLLPAGAPFIQPKDLAPILGISEDMVRHYCRGCRELKSWKGSYRFFTDDAQHMEKLAAVVKLALWSMKKLPPHLRLH